MKAIKSVNVGSFVLYGAVLVAFWTFVFGVYYWILGWIFGAQAWWIDMNLANWSAYTLVTFLYVLWEGLLNALGGALAVHRHRHVGGRIEPVCRRTEGRDDALPVGVE